MSRYKVLVTADARYHKPGEIVMIVGYPHVTYQVVAIHGNEVILKVYRGSRRDRIIRFFKRTLPTEWQIAIDNYLEQREWNRYIKQIAQAVREGRQWN